MGRNIDCLRCGQRMNHIRTEKLQLGQTGWILGDLPNLFAGAMEVDIYSCPKCRKLEFFLAEDLQEELPQKQYSVENGSTIKTAICFMAIRNFGGNRYIKEMTIWVAT